MDKEINVIINLIEQNENEVWNITLDHDYGESTTKKFGIKNSVRFNILNEYKKPVPFTGSIVTYYSKDALNNQESKKQQLLAQGEIKDGYAEGKWCYYFDNSYDRDFPNDNKDKVVHYRSGTLHGEAKRWQQNGTPYDEGNYKDGEKDGKWINYNAYSGKKQCEEIWKNGQEIGVRLSFYPNGQIKSEYHLNKRGVNVTDTEWYENGQIKKEEPYNNDGEKDGKWIMNSEDGQKLWERNYKNGIEHGALLAWHKNGQKKSKINYENGKIIGESISWRDNGKVEERSHYENGEKTGKEIRWDENGQKMEEGTFKDGQEDGKWTFWSPDGKESSELIYKDGEPWDGLYTFWWFNGNKGKEQTYKNGDEISVKSWNEDGTEIES